MTIQNRWPLFFLILIPVILLLYLLKQKVKEEPFSTTMLWREIYKNLEAKTPFEKLKQNILMYLQILLMILLILSLMAPMLKKGGKAEENIVLVIDNSASMQYLYEGEESRLEYSIKAAKQEVDGLNDDSLVTLITCGAEPVVVYQGKDKRTLKSRLEQIAPTMDAGTLAIAANAVHSAIAGMENVRILCYTDTDFDAEELKKGNEDAKLSVFNVYSEGENCSLDYVNYSVNDDGKVEALCKVSNYGNKEISQDVSLYADDRIVDVVPVTVAPKGSETVYFNEQPMNTDGSVILTAELSAKDSLTADNRQSLSVVANQEKKILLLSDGNVFLEKALSLDENVEVYKSDDSGVLNQTEDRYDLYVFDGTAFQEEIKQVDFPEHAAFLFFNEPEDIAEREYIRKDKEAENTFLTFADSDVTQYVEGVTFGVTKTYTYELPDWGIPVLKTGQGEVAGYYGRQGDVNIAVIGFDIHNTDLALQTEFPIFMSQLSETLLGSGAEESEVINFPVSQESDVTAATEITSAKDGTEILTGGRSLRNVILFSVILLLVAEWIIYVRQVHTNKKKQFLAVRFLVLFLIILAMAGVSIPKKQKMSETIFLVDLSDSMTANREEIREYLQKTIGDMPQKNRYGIVAFGKETAVEQFLTDQKIFSEFTVAPVTSATNIEKAVQAATGMFDEDVGKQLILITDGCENEGNMSLSATTLKENDVEFYALTMEDSVGGGHEVYIDDLTAPKVIHVGDHYNVTVSVTSNVETEASLLLYAGRNLKGQQEIHLNKGNNRFVFEDVGEEGTIAQYKAVLEAEKDTISVNNTYVTFAQIEARPKVLLVEGKAEEGNEFEKVLQAANIDYDKVTPVGVPTSISELNRYKAVITLDVYYEDLRNGFADALETYVKEYAGGYICIGGENSYALGGYRGTELEAILPVDMDLQGEKEIPKMAMTMVIDQSGSMTDVASDNSSVTSLDLAKQAAISGVSELRNTDEAGVLAFDDRFNWTVPLAVAEDMESVKEQIRTIGLGGGTSIYPALQEAYEKTLKSDAKLKHIVLLTDGQDEFRDYGSLIHLLNDAQITLSTVAVGEGADTLLLSDLADRCGGRYYYTDVNNSIPRIFAQEVYLSTRSYLVNGDFVPIMGGSHDILNGVIEEGWPSFLGYVATSAKQSADVILESEEGDPLLAAWQCGLGRTVAWTSDGNNEWTADFAGWDNYPALWSNIVNYVISDTELGEDNLEVKKEGNTATISYETKEYDKNTTVTAVITDEEGNTKEVLLDAVKPGAFETNLDMDEIGVYSVNVRKYSGEEILKNYNTAYANQYSAEYQFAKQDADFATFVKQAGGTEITFDHNIWREDQKAIRTKMSLTVPLLILAIFLFLVDIIIRRFSVDLALYIRSGFSWIGQHTIGVFVKKIRDAGGRRKDRTKAVDHKTMSDPATEGREPVGANSEREADINGGEPGMNPEKDVTLKKAAKKASKIANPSSESSGKHTRGDKASGNTGQNEKLDMNQLLKKKQERS